jgi:hypothetical protein
MSNVRNRKKQGTTAKLITVNQYSSKRERIKEKGERQQRKGKEKDKKREK